MITSRLLLYEEVMELQGITRATAGLAVGAGAMAAIDSGLGLLKRVNSYPKIMRVERQPDAPNRIIILFHGYNGHGETLVRILGGALSAYGTVVGFEPTGARYDNEKVLDAVDEAIDSCSPDEIVVYGESFGSLTVADWLRRHPSLFLEGWVLNASPSGLSDALGAGNWTKIFDWLHGGPISTALLRTAQRYGMKNLPPLEPGADAAAAEQAYQLALQITAPMIFGEVSYIRNWSPPRVNEFAGRVGVARYIHAPAPRGHDGRIRVTAASPIWGASLPDADFRDIVVESWEKETHTPTAERPSGLLNHLVAVLQ